MFAVARKRYSVDTKNILLL